MARFQRVFSRFPALARFVTWAEYELISRLAPQAGITLLNFGYADLNGQAPLSLEPEDERQRFQIQMYHHVACVAGNDWATKQVLEISSGRGGGAAYLYRRFKPAQYTGLDLSDTAVAFCRRYHTSGKPDLRFVPGNASRLPFDDASFDIVINVEASLYYPDVPQFLSEVVRVLKPGGYFLYTDLRYEDELTGWQSQLCAMPLAQIMEENITPNVVQALEIDRARKLALIKRYAPAPLRQPFSLFAGINGAGMVGETLPSKRRVYMRYVFRAREDVS
jgi:ubiquinone/menaquinone biosynthesis C-methylase UbiE